MKTVQGVFLLVLVTACVGSAYSQASRTWVSGVGDDVNPCSRTAPCKTFAGAISKTAYAGEISCLDPGGFGAVTITKSITIDCTGTLGSILAAQTNGIIINLQDTDKRQGVRLRGIQINGVGNGVNGIRILSQTRVTIENSAIDGFTQAALSVESEASVVVSNTSLTGSNIGISETAKGNVRLVRSIITGNVVGVDARSGLVLSYSDNLIEGNGKNGNYSLAP